ncbi:MAG: type II toxin-antitoxin system RatA family toxin [Alphaproteobacteria bacterium]|nr:type II toxin-antitoxin system RatA family toxin [Alphaproteobacteria bacterium]
MPHVAVKRAVPLTLHQVFAIAADVASYKEFLPLCTRSTIRGAVEEQGGVKRFSADLQISITKLGLHESFTSRVEADDANKMVVATSADGPLKSLRAEWTMKAIDGARSEVAITIDYELKSKLLQLAAGSMMDHAVARVLEAFEARGRKLYPASALANI